MSTTGNVDPRWASKQALASGRIEGHIPTTEFLADCAAVNAGNQTMDQLRAASLARALAANRAATVVGAGTHEMNAD